MAGKPGQKGRKPSAIPAKYRPGFLSGTDRRFVAARLVKALLAELHEALGGVAELTPQQRALTERATWLHVRLQQMEQEYLAGQGLDAGEYTQLTNSLLGVLKALGLGRRARSLPRALEYAAQVAAGEPDGGAP